MKTISTTLARKNIKSLINFVREHNEPVAIGRHDKPEAILLRFPYAYSADFSEIANLNAYSAAFDFLADEPDLYTKSDVKHT